MATEPVVYSWRRPKLQTNRVADSLAAELRQRILRNGYPAGAGLPKQDELVAEFGVSYPSVREALRILEAEGLITVRRGNIGGAEIRRPDAASAAYALGLALEADSVRLTDLAESLLIFEPVCASMCARRLDRNDAIVPKLRENLAATESLIDDELGFTRSARDFHDIIVVSTGSDTIRLTVHSLVSLWTAHEQNWAQELSQRGEYFDIQGRRQVIAAHSAILARIEAGDVRGAERAARKHVEHTQRLYLERFKDEIVDAASAKINLAHRSLV